MKNEIVKEYYEDLFHSSGEYVLKSEVPYVNKTKHGLCKTYHPFKNMPKKLAGELHYVNGKRQGLCKTYYPTGELRAEFTFVDDEKEGVGKEWHREGFIQNEVTWKNSKENGLTKCYYPDGKIRANFDYKDGLKDGPYEEFYETGESMGKGEYYKNKAHGILTSFYKSGKKKREGCCNRGEKKWVKEWDEEGNLIASTGDWRDRDREIED